MQELVGMLMAEDKSGAAGLREDLVNLLLSFPLSYRQSGNFSDIPQAGEVLQSLLGGGGQSLQLPGHKIYHVVRVVHCMDTFDVPLPSLYRWIEERSPSSARAVKNWIAKSGFLESFMAR
jgi:hypothetical protein